MTTAAKLAITRSEPQATQKQELLASDHPSVLKALPSRQNVQQQPMVLLKKRKRDPYRLQHTDRMLIVVQNDEQEFPKSPSFLDSSCLDETFPFVHPRGQIIQHNSMLAPRIAYTHTLAARRHTFPAGDRLSPRKPDTIQHVLKERVALLASCPQTRPIADDSSGTTTSVIRTS